jgi:hypothetical protein
MQRLTSVTRDIHQLQAECQCAGEAAALAERIL